jgi:hypothetical protein
MMKATHAIKRTGMGCMCVHGPAYMMIARKAVIGASEPNANEQALRLILF